jgi:hypothetical protein
MAKLVLIHFTVQQRYLILKCLLLRGFVEKIVKLFQKIFPFTLHKHLS